MLLRTDYLVVGAGATGLAFADALTAEADVEVTLVDRRPTAGGHWLQAYPFVRLHTPSVYYGVNSLSLGRDRIDQGGENAGFYERATGDEVRDYFAEAATRLIETGRVRVLTGHEQSTWVPASKASGSETSAADSSTISPFVARSWTRATLRRRSRRRTSSRSTWLRARE